MAPWNNVLRSERRNLLHRPVFRLYETVGNGAGGDVCEPEIVRRRTTQRYGTPKHHPHTSDDRAINRTGDEKLLDGQTAVEVQVLQATLHELCDDRRRFAGQRARVRADGNPHRIGCDESTTTGVDPYGRSSDAAPTWRGYVRGSIVPPCCATSLHDSRWSVSPCPLLRR
jgi:hypothetical protein